MDELKRALEFYERSPDGQYDGIAALCIRHYIHALERAAVEHEILERPLRHG